MANLASVFKVSFPKAEHWVKHLFLGIWDVFPKGSKYTQVD